MKTLTEEIDRIFESKPADIKPALVIVPTYRSPTIREQIREKARADTREHRWSMHRLQLASLIFHVTAVIANIGWGISMITSGNRFGFIQIIIGGGINVLFAFMAWRRAKGTFS